MNPRIAFELVVMRLHPWQKTYHGPAWILPGPSALEHQFSEKNVLETSEPQLDLGSGRTRALVNQNAGKARRGFRRGGLLL